MNQKNGTVHGWTLPQYKPRPEQIEIIEEINQAIAKGYKNIILEAGTGIGKSAIATTISQTFQDSYLLTMTNQLQEQYLNDFSTILTKIKGRRNYQCNQGGSCEYCPLDNTDIPKCVDCKYLIALRHAQASPKLITNYDYIYYAGNYAHLFHNRELLILDESHNLEQKIMSLVSKTLNRDTLIKYIGEDIFDDIVSGKYNLKDLKTNEYWVEKLRELLEVVNSTLRKLKLKKRESKNKEDSPKIKYLQNRLFEFNKLIEDLSDPEQYWIINTPSKKDILAWKDELKVEFKPLTVEEYGELITQYGDVRLFMTGTLGSWKRFCKWIGLNIRDTYYIYKKSPFPVQNRPIIRDYVCSMKGKRFGVENWRNKQAIEKIKELLKKHENDKGVIHTSSNDQAWYIKNHIKDKRLIVIQGEKREEILSQFQNTHKPKVLIGAGIKDGVDLKDDLCRFQIIYKVPFPALEGQTLIRKNHDLDWYIHQTIMPLMQAYGRGVRDINDYCTTYVIDSDFEELLRDYRELFNEYFLEAVI